MKAIYHTLVFLLAGLLLFSSCEQFFVTDSNRLMYENDYEQLAKTDSVYSLLGILTRLQKVADRHVLLNELRGDLTCPNKYTSGDLRDIATFSATVDNSYNNIRDYYEIINGCNAYIACLDTTKNRYISEYTAAKVIRAWTYLQIATHYGEATYFTDPILTVKDNNQEYPSLGINELCPLLIADLEPLSNFGTPSFGDILSMNSSYFFIPVKVMLGDLYLWNREYFKAAESYYDFITAKKMPLGSYQISYNDATFASVSDRWSVTWSSILPDETLCFIPMAVNSTDGLTSKLDSLFGGGRSGHYQVEPSDSYIETCLSQSYYLSEADIHTTGDLRIRGAVNGRWTGGMLTDTLNIMKNAGNTVLLYRLSHVYLRFAEACNLAGYPSLAFTALKYGLSAGNISRHVSDSELRTAARFLNFREDIFDNNRALHARGSGNSADNDRYRLSVGDSVWIYDAERDSAVYVQASPEHKAAVMDSLDLLILDEMALETSFEGCRFSDLLRFTLRRNDPDFLAKKIAGRSAEFDDVLYLKLLDKKNWYLPKE